MNRMNRIKKLQLELDSFNIDALLVTKKENIRYLTGFTGSFAYLVIARDKVFFLTDFRYLEQVKNETVGIDEVVCLKKYSVSYFVGQIASRGHYEKIGFEYQALNYAFYNELLHFFKASQLIATNHLIENQRMVKDEHEIELIKIAEAIGDRVFNDILDYIKIGVSEQEIALEIDYRLRKYGASGNSFNTIVASGHRSALPHGLASDKKIEDGDIIVMDYGCFYQGYASDMTRTVGIGKIDDFKKNIYEIVKNAQKLSLEAIHAGVIGSDIHKIAQNYITKSGYGEYFGHGLGHSVGLEIHEMPNFNLAEKRTITAGMCLTVEPGIYLPNQFGVRIEDLVVVRDNGAENLTNSSKAFVNL